MQEEPDSEREHQLQEKQDGEKEHQLRKPGDESEHLRETPESPVLLQQRNCNYKWP